MHATLLKPYLNDKANLVVSRLEPSLADDYELLKETILREFKTTPTYLLNKFQTMTKDSSETYILLWPPTIALAIAKTIYFADVCFRHQIFRHFPTEIFETLPHGMALASTEPLLWGSHKVPPKINEGQKSQILPIFGQNRNTFSSPSRKFHRPVSTHARDICYQKSRGQTEKQTNSNQYISPACLSACVIGE